MTTQNVVTCFAYALLPHLCLQRAGAQGQWRSHKAAGLSTTAMQEQRRGLLWDDLLTYLKEKCHRQFMLKEWSGFALPEKRKISQPE
jgi:hypothetical protein